MTATPTYYERGKAYRFNPQASSGTETMTARPIDAGIPVPEESPEKLKGSDATRIIESIPLDGETQAAIYELCEENKALFCAVMAVAKVETGHDPESIGDSGRSVGMMQINYSYHMDRITRLGVTDLLDPVQNAAVGLDYLKELSSEFGAGTGSHVLYVAYNRGAAGARELFNQGIYSTHYTWDVVDWYNQYMSEISGEIGGQG